MTLKAKVLSLLTEVGSPHTVADVHKVVDIIGEWKPASVSSALYDLFNEGKLDAGKQMIHGKATTVFYAPLAAVADDPMAAGIQPIPRGRKRGGKEQVPPAVTVYVTLPGPDGKGEVRYPLPLAQKIYGELQNVFESGLFKPQQ